MIRHLWDIRSGDWDMGLRAHTFWYLWRWLWNTDFFYCQKNRALSSWLNSRECWNVWYLCFLQFPSTMQRCFCGAAKVLFGCHASPGQVFCRLWSPPVTAARHKPFCRPGLTDSNFAFLALNIWSVTFAFKWGWKLNFLKTAEQYEWESGMIWTNLRLNSMLTHYLVNEAASEMSSDK